jgi:hypothetical protein
VADDAEVPVTEADVRALAAKLKGLHALLTPAEQALLHAVLRRAAGCRSETTDAEGAAWAVRFNPFPYLDAVAAGAARVAPRPGPVPRWPPANK